MPRSAGRGQPLHLLIAGDALLQMLDIAADHGQEIVEVVRYAAGQLPDRFHLLRLTKRVLGALPLPGLLGDPLLQGLVHMLEVLLRLAARGDLALGGLVEPCIVDRGGGLPRHADDDPLRPLGEDAGLGMAEEQAADHFARPRYDRDRQIGAHRQMPLRHAVIRRVLPVSRIGQDVVGAHRARAGKGRIKRGRGARQRKIGERLALCARQRVERAGHALRVDHVVEERAELGADELDCGVGHGLDEPLQAELGRERGTGPVENLERARLLAHFADARFQGLVEREQPRLERLAIGDVEKQPAEPALAAGFVRHDLALAGHPAYAAFGAAHAELNIEGAAVRRGLGRRAQLQRVVAEDEAFALDRGGCRYVGGEAEENRDLGRPFPRAFGEVPGERRDAAGNLGKPGPLLGRQRGRARAAHVRPFLPCMHMGRRNAEPAPARNNSGTTRQAMAASVPGATASGIGSKELSGIA